MISNPFQLPFFKQTKQILGLPRWLNGKESTCIAGDMGLIPELGRSPGKGNGNPLQYSCLGNPLGRGAWWAIVHEVAESDMTERLNNKHTIQWSCSLVFSQTSWKLTSTQNLHAVLYGSLTHIFQNLKKATMVSFSR